MTVKPRSTTAFRLPPELHEQLRVAAEEREVSINFLVVRAIEAFLPRLLPLSEIRWTRDERDDR